MASKRAKDRQRLSSKFGALYFPFKPPGHWRDSSCVYCGDIAEARDHIPPMVWLDVLGTDYFHSSQSLIVWVPSCWECNAALGDRRLFTIRERTLWLLGHYCRKYQRLLRSEAWSIDELAELTGRLKQAIEGYASRQLGIDRRISILEENLQVRLMRESHA